jgi:hypothetical protein
MSDVEATLEERGSNYGSFADNAVTTQLFKIHFRSRSSWNEMDAHHKEALDMIAHKLARIVNGDPNYADSWVDIAGYATLVVKEIQNEHG